MKIDRSFTACLGHGGHDETVAMAVIRLAHELGIRTLAEGVEHPAQAAHLRTLGGALAQGYYFSHPLMPDELARLLRHQVPFARQVRTSRTRRATSLVERG